MDLVQFEKVVHHSDIRMGSTTYSRGLGPDGAIHSCIQACLRKIRVWKRRALKKCCDSESLKYRKAPSRSTQPAPSQLAGSSAIFPRTPGTAN